MNYCKGCEYAGLDGMDCYSCSKGSNYVPNELEAYKKEIADLKKDLINFDENLTKAKSIIKDLLSILPKENIEGVYEITEEAEQFIKEMKND